MDLLDLLKSFCDPDELCREALRRPFNIDDFTYATNGHVAIRINKVDEFKDNPVIANIESVMKYPLVKEKEWLVIPEIKMKQCEVCKGKGKDFSCEDCNGTGNAILFSRSGLEYEDIHCDLCNGHGFIKGFCSECLGTGKVSINRHIDVGSKRLDCNYLYRISLFPKARIAPDVVKKYDPIPFVFDGGIGIIMPVRKDLKRV